MKEAGVALVAALMSAAVARAGINIPSDGSDGGLYVTNDTVIDLSQAVTGNWDDDNSANAGKGIYDSNKWAVVFKFANVYVATGATVTFSSHPSRAPVVWLVDGDATIDGPGDLRGEAGRPPPRLTHPGPGGFRGGMLTYSTLDESPGFGPGGGRRDANLALGTGGGGGSYATGETPYGNPSLLPLLGGSGGAACRVSAPEDGGGAGGGAFLLACRNAISISGVVRANGGAGASQGFNGQNFSGGGAGGGIRLVAESLGGNGLAEALGGATGGVDGPTYGGNGGHGRIRIERVVDVASWQVLPSASVVSLTNNATPLTWLPTHGPTARIVSIGGVDAPLDPRASFGTYGPDVAIPECTNTPVVVETVNAEQASEVLVRLTPRADGDYTVTTAAVAQVVSTDPLVIRWIADVPVNPGFSAVQVQVIRP